MKRDDLKARLLRTRKVTNPFRGPNMPLKVDGLVNPDGPEAATAITDLEALVGELGEALGEAVDVFDGMCDDEINEELMPRLRATLAKLEKARG